MSYYSRNKYASCNEKIYSTVVQETQAELALPEVAETIFQENLNQKLNQTEKRSGLLSGTGTLQQKIRLYVFESLMVKTQNQKKTILLVLSPQEVATNCKKKSKPSLMKKWTKLATTETFKACFSNFATGVLISRSKK